MSAIERRVLLAPDKFKGTFSAGEVADLLAQGFAAQGWQAVRLPVADGGEGTAQALLSARGGRWVQAPASDALGRTARARFAVLADGRTAVVEAAAASGLWRLADEERDPIAATTRGTGELIAAAGRGGASTVIVAAGGSASTDGGLGAIEALEALDELPRLVVACDVQTPWEDAARVFGPQKGASAAQVAQLAERLEALAAAAPVDPWGVPMTGCAGGLSGGLWAWCGAELAAGGELVLDAIGFDERLAQVDLVVTGEGRIDGQTLAGKAASVVAARSRAAGLPCVAVAGIDGLREGDREALGLTEVIEAGTAAELAQAGGSIARSMGAIRPGQRERVSPRRSGAPVREADGA